jgi:hypothetical protein
MDYAGRRDGEVLELAKAALKKAATLPPGSIERAIQWSVFDAHMGELRRRAMAAVLAAIEAERRDE